MLLIFLVVSYVSAQTQCDLEHNYMIGDIAIPSVVDSEPMFMDDYTKVLTDEEKQIEESQHSRSKRAAVRDRSRIWPDNTVPYLIDDDFSDYYKKLLRKAMDTWEEATCITFLPRTKEQDYIHIKNGRRCCSYVGRQRRGAQKIALDPGCMQHGILLHELGHVIGFWHEQNRPDRDDYIKVIKNYHESVRYNFQKLNESQVYDYGVPYDYGSIMHYGRTFFSMDGKSITLLPKDGEVEIGQRTHLSELDIIQANRLYMCQEDCSWTYNASEGPKTIQSMNYPSPYPSKVDCITKIYTVPNEVIRINFEVIKIEHHSECSYDYIEVRDGDLHTSPVLGRFCGDLPPRNFTSSGSALWIKFHSDSSVTKSGFFAHFSSISKKEAPSTQVNPCYLKTCEHKCIVFNGQATCTCPLGYMIDKDGFSCGDFNECQHNNGGCSHICLNSQGSFQCLCPRGYVLGANNRTCIDIDECSGESKCTQLCINTPGSYYCSCRPGYKLLSDYYTCQDKDECVKDNGGCQQECHNFVGGYECRCSPGFILSSDSKTCLDRNECEYGNGDCDHECVNTVGSYYCTCYNGYQVTANTSCSDIDECKVNNGGCDQMCINYDGGYSCACNPGYKVDEAELHSCKDIDECEEGLDRCDDMCVNTMGSYDCQCQAPRFTLHPDGYSCIEAVIPDKVKAENFEAKHGNQSPYCGAPLRTQPCNLQSPLFPNSYPINTSCNWGFQGNKGEVLRLTFRIFDVEHHRHCGFDSVKIYDGLEKKDGLIGHLCGHVAKPFTMTSSSNNAMVQFKSDNMVTKHGFSVYIDYIHERTCHERLYVDKRPRKLMLVDNGEFRNCSWVFNGTDNRGVTLFFKKVFKRVPSYSKICYTHNPLLQVIDIETNTVLKSYCKYNPPPPHLFFQHSRIKVYINNLAAFNKDNFLIFYSSRRKYSG